MIRALENNTLGVVLASLSGVLLLACLGMIVVWAMPPSSEGSDDVPSDEGTEVSVASLQSANPLETYSVVSERPVFNEDRRPAPVLADGGAPEDDYEDEYFGAPDVVLAGIIITPSLRMATLKSPEHQYSLVAFEGQPLEGDFGTWQVSRIEERMVTLASADGEEMQLELQVHDAVIREPPKTRKAADKDADDSSAENVVAANQAVSGEPLTRADEIRQRIEERREELRRAAEASEQGQAENYRDAIQDMIQNTRKDADELKEIEQAEKQEQ